MPRTTPEEAFAAAQAAIARQDWDAFFACLDPGDVRRVVKNGLARLGRDRRIEELCRDVGVEQALLDPVKTFAGRMANAAHAALAGGSDESLALRGLVDAHKRALDALVKGVQAIDRLAAALERHLREAAGGGSVSSSLFVGDTLEAVRVDGNTAWGARRSASGAVESVGFVRRAGEWQVRLFARPRAS
jgi:hypothetical protein